jgi:hypothetical protein
MFLRFARKVADVLLAHDASPIGAGTMEFSPLYYALRRRLTPLAERLIPLTITAIMKMGDICQITLSETIESYLRAALIPLRHCPKIDSLSLLLDIYLHTYETKPSFCALAWVEDLA